jgi:hypothetical protein
MAATAPSLEPWKDERPTFETVRLKAGGYAVKAPFRPSRPIFIYGFRREAEAWAWIERTKARLAK